MRRSLLIAALLLPPIFVPAACTTVPGTGRSRINFMSLSDEMTLGQQSYDETLKTAKLITSGKDYDMVQRLGTKIAAAAVRMYPDPSKEFQWKVVLIDDPKTVNAWCMPGGKIAVYSGLLPVTQDENSLAIVVGHEVGHAVARHGGERMSDDTLLQGVLTGIAAGTGKMDPAKHDQLMQALTGAGNYGFTLPFSRKHESEADELGLFMAADAGYDPHAAIGLWDRMAQMSKGSAPPALLSTHPSDADRKKNLQKLMPQAVKIWEAAKQRGT